MNQAMPSIECSLIATGWFCVKQGSRVVPTSGHEQNVGDVWYYSSDAEELTHVSVANRDSTFTNLSRVSVPLSTYLRNDAGETTLFEKSLGKVADKDANELIRKASEEKGGLKNLNGMTLQPGQRDGQFSLDATAMFRMIRARKEADTVEPYNEKGFAADVAEWANTTPLFYRVIMDRDVKQLASYVLDLPLLQIEELYIDPDSLYFALDATKVKLDNDELQRSCLASVTPKNARKRWFARQRRRFVEGSVKTIADLTRLMDRLNYHMLQYKQIDTKAHQKNTKTINRFKVLYSRTSQVSGTKQKLLTRVIEFMQLMVLFAQLIEKLHRQCVKGSYVAVYSCLDIRLGQTLLTEGCNQHVLQKLSLWARKTFVNTDGEPSMDLQLAYRDLLLLAHQLRRGVSAGSENMQS